MGKNKYPDRFYTDPGAQRCLCSYCKHYHGWGVCDWYSELPRELECRVMTDSHDCGNGHHFEPKEENWSVDCVSETRADLPPNFKPEHIRKIEDIIHEIAEQEENCPERRKRDWGTHDG